MPTIKKLNLVAFAIPYPPNYGGAIDVFYKIKNLHALGVSIVLHVFRYDTREIGELEKYCDKIYFYERKRSFFDQLSFLPFIVKSRDSLELLGNLKSNNYPILFEGLHTTFVMNHPDLQNRSKFLRMHNIESDYYSHLCAAEKSWLKKLFFWFESKKLKKYENRALSGNIKIIAISKKDEIFLNKQFGNTTMVGAFHAFNTLQIKEGKGNFAFYHGKLDVAENNEAALFLVQKVFSKINYPLIIAGSNPSFELMEEAKKYAHIEIKSSISTDQINALLQDAQVNVLPTFQATGVKLKLLSALYSGRFCLVNDFMIKGTGLDQYCTVVNDPEEWMSALKKIENNVFSSELVEERREIVSGDFSNEPNAKKLYKILFASS